MCVYGESHCHVADTSLNAIKLHVLHVRLLTVGFFKAVNLIFTYMSLAFWRVNNHFKSLRI